MFRRFRILCFVLKLVFFNDFVKSQGGNPPGLNCKFCISRVVVAVLNSILYHCRHILIRSYNEKKLQQGVKKSKFSYVFMHFSYNSKKYRSLFLILPSFHFVSNFSVLSDYSVKEELIITNYYVIQ